MARMIAQIEANNQCSVVNRCVFHKSVLRKIYKAANAQKLQKFGFRKTRQQPNFLHVLARATYDSLN